MKRASVSKVTDALPNLDQSCFKIPQQQLLVSQQVSEHPPRILMLYGSLRERSYSKLMTAARALANEILECAPLAVQASKQVMLQSLQTPDLEQAMNARYDLAEQMLKSQDAIEGPLAFAEKRPPKWTGIG